MQKYDVTLVITTYNEEKYLPILLSSIKNQNTTLSIEVIIVDDGSTDDTLNIAKSSAYKIIHNDKKSNVQYMRNMGLKEAMGEIIIFCDADVAISSNYIERMCRPIIENKYDTTLCKTYAILEAFYDVLPKEYSKSYAWYLRHAPRFMVKRFPVQLGYWLLLWLRTMIKQKRLLSIWNIPNRAHTTGIATRTNLSRMAGGWNVPIGHGDDARYSYDIFAQSDRIIWDRKSTLYISRRRVFPKNSSWIKHALFGWAIKLYHDIKKIDKNNYKESVR